MFPAFAHFARTATCDTELHGQKIREGEKVVMWYPSSNRDETRYEDPDRFDMTRNPEHQAFGAGGRHFCLGTALARLELRILIEETLARFPEIEIAGTPTLRRVAVRQPAQDAAGTARALATLRGLGPLERDRELILRAGGGHRVRTPACARGSSPRRRDDVRGCVQYLSRCLSNTSRPSATWTFCSMRSPTPPVARWSTA